MFQFPAKAILPPYQLGRSPFSLISLPEKSLLLPLKKRAGRNSQGRITVRHRGGGAKRRLRIIDFKRDKIGVPGRVAAIEYDPNRSARIALIYYADGDKRYILSPLGLNVGDTIKAGGFHNSVRCKPMAYIQI